MQAPVGTNTSYGIALPKFRAPFLTNYLPDFQVEKVNNISLIKIQLKDQPDPIILTTCAFAEIDQTQRNAYVKIQDKNKVVVFAKIDDLSTLLKCERSIMALQARAGNLRFILSTAQNFSNQDPLWNNKLKMEVERLVFFKGSTNGNCPAEHLERIKKWCEENKNKLNEALKEAQALDPHIAYIVVKKRDSKLPYNFEFRSDEDIRIHLQRNAAQGSIMMLSKHLVLLTGNKVNKLKGCLSGYIYKECKRQFTAEQVLLISTLLNLIPDVEGVVKHVFAPEIVKKDTCIFTHGVRYYRYVEDLDERNLFDYYITNKLKIDFKYGCRLASELCLILDRLHKAGVVHRDITLGNIMYQRDEATGQKIPKINDFDLADLIDQEQVVTKGNPSYVDAKIIYLSIKRTKEYPKDLKPSPVRGIVNAKSDIYSLGAAIYTLFTGRLVVVSEKFSEGKCGLILDKQGNYNEEFVHGCQGSDRLHLRKYPESFRTCLMSMMHPVPEQRPLLTELAQKFLDFAN